MHNILHTFEALEPLSVRGGNYGHHGATLKGKCLIKTFSLQHGTVYVLFSVVSCLASSCVNDFLALKSERNLQHKMREGLLLVVVRGFRTFSFKCFFNSADAKRVVITLTFYHLASRSNCLST